MCRVFRLPSQSIADRHICFSFFNRGITCLQNKQITENWVILILYKGILTFLFFILITSSWKNVTKWSPDNRTRPTTPPPSQENEIRSVLCEDDSWYCLVQQLFLHYTAFSYNKSDNCSWQGAERDEHGLISIGVHAVNVKLFENQH